MTLPAPSTTTSEALIALALAEGAISDADARRLRGHVVKTSADAPTIERLLVRHHAVPPERARALRQRVEVGSPPAPAAPPAPAPASPPAPGDDAPAVLILYPADEGAEPTAAQRAAAGELSPGDVDALLRDPLPRLERRGTVAALRPLAARLRAVGVDAHAAAPPALEAPRPLLRVRLEKATLTLVSSDGELEADLTKPTLLVLGKGDERSGRARFLHIYAGGRATPFEVHERTGFPSFLGQRDPFQSFLSAAQALGGVSSSDLLLVHAEQVERSTPAVDLPALAAKNVASPRAAALSRVLYDAWLDGLSLDPAALAHAVQEKKAERASGRQPRPERPSERLSRPAPSAFEPTPSAFEPAAASPDVRPPNLAHIMRGGSMPAQVAAATAGRAPPQATGAAADLLNTVTERVKAIGPQRLVIAGSVLVLAFLIYIFVEAGSGIVWHVKEDPAHGAAHAKNTIRVVVLADNNKKECVTFKLDVLNSPEVRAVADQYVWQDDREEPRNGGYDRAEDYDYLEPGTGVVPFIFVYNAQKQIVTGIRGAGDMTPEQFVAFLAAAKADPRSGKERRGQ